MAQSELYKCKIYCIYTCTTQSPREARLALGLRSACARFHRPDRVQGKEIRALRLWGMYLDSPTVYCLRSASSLNGATFNFKGENV